MFCKWEPQIENFVDIATLGIYMFLKHVFFKLIAITNNVHQNYPLYPNITFIKCMDYIPHHYFLLIIMPQSAHTHNVELSMAACCRYIPRLPPPQAAAELEEML